MFVKEKKQLLIRLKYLKKIQYLNCHSINAFPFVENSHKNLSTELNGNEKLSRYSLEIRINGMGEKLSALLPTLL